MSGVDLLGGDETEEHLLDDVEEGDSVCSWMSESESVVHNWRGWRGNKAGSSSSGGGAEIKGGGGRRQNSSSTTAAAAKSNGGVVSLSELAAISVASWIPFELVEAYYPPVPEDVQLRIAYWSFPDSEEDIRLYSCLANGCVEEYVKGEALVRAGAVRDSLQIGFHLSASVSAPDGGKPPRSTSLTFDRKRIVSCQCSCEAKADWCSHIVASSLHRIQRPVSLRAPVSESLSRLRRDQLQKFAQYLIAELPLQILPAAQKILDELLCPGPSAINALPGAPDPTAGGCATETPTFTLDDKNLKVNISRTLIKFCVPSPLVFSDVNYLSTTPPLSSAEWTALLRPLRGREPEGIWNLLSIVREMFRRSDHNALPLLEILTGQTIETAQIMVWWFSTKSSALRSLPPKASGNTQASQNACAYLCDEIVTLWKLAALNPVISPRERSLLKAKLLGLHSAVIAKIQANAKAPARVKAGDLEAFPGFKPAIEGTHLDWGSYPIPGVTYGHNDTYVSPFAVFKGQQGSSGQVNSSQAVLRCEYPGARPLAAASREASNESDEGVELSGRRGSVAAAVELEDELEDDSDSCEGPGPSEAPVPSNAGGNSGAPGNAASSEDLQYRVYFYESGAGSSVSEKEKDSLDVLKNLRLAIEDPWEVLFLRAEGLFAHGFLSEACSLARRLAEDLLKSDLDLLGTLEKAGGHKRHKRAAAACHAVTLSASNTLSQAAFLANVLLENTGSHSLAFRIALFGLELPRPPASSKPLEVKLAHQEGELVGILKRIPQGPWETSVIREKALGLKDGTLKSRGEALLPLSLASFVFESLSLPSSRGEEGGNSSSYLYTDELLGFEAAVEAIGMKSSVSEADHPLLCEGTRRQRGELVLHLLLTYKNDPVKIAKIMDKLLDKEVHPLFKAPITPQLYATGNNGGGNSGSGNNSNNIVGSPSSVRRMGSQFEGLSLRGEGPRGAVGGPSGREWGSLLEDSGGGGVNNGGPKSDHLPPSSSSSRRNPRPDSDSGSSGNSSAESVDSSSSSSTRAPTSGGQLARALPAAYASSQQHGQASGGGPPGTSGGASGGSAGGSSWGGMRKGGSMGGQGYNPVVYMPVGPVVPGGGGHRGKSGGGSGSRYRGGNGKRPYPSLPNQPSDSLAHFMYELAKTVLTKAGGSTSSSLFNQELSESSRGPHRALLMAAFQIGLYSLGLYNAVSPNWLSRTYSSQVYWVTSQALEIGAPAIIFLIGTWEGHLSPPEAASIADRVSRGRESAVVRASAELALSVLPHASSLKVMEIQRAIAQCQAQSGDMLERACSAVEKAASNGGGVHPEVLFEVARHWHSLWEKTGNHNNNNLSSNNNSNSSNASSNSVVPPAAPPQCVLPPPIESAQQQIAAQVAAAAAFPFYGLISRFPSSLQMYVSPHHTHPLQFQRLALTPAPPYYPPAAAAAAAAANPRVFGGGIYAHPPAAAALGVLNSSPQLSAVSAPGAAGGNAVLPQSGVPPSLHHHHPLHPQLSAPVSPVAPPNPPPLAPASSSPASGGPSQRFLISAYRVGMLALESLGRRSSEERPEVRFAQNPAYGPDVIWLKSIARMLGLTYFQNFLVVVGATIASPFLLQDLALEGAVALSGSGGAGSGAGPPPLGGYSSIIQSIRSNPHLTQLANKCYQMYYQCIHQRLFQLSPEDYEEFTGIILHARKAFYWTVDGPRTFQTLLQSIRRSKSCKKELWQKVFTSVQNTSIEQQL